MITWILAIALLASVLLNLGLFEYVAWLSRCIADLHAKAGGRS